MAFLHVRAIRMSEGSVRMPFGELPTFVNYLIKFVDILVVWFVIYKLIMVVRGTKAVQLLKGIIVIILVRIVSSFIGLSTLQWLMDQAITWGFLAIIIIFQPELRRALEQLGRENCFLGARRLKRKSKRTSLKRL